MNTMVWLWDVWYITYPLIIILLWAVFRKIPSLLRKIIEGYVQNQFSKNLEEFKSEAQASYSTVGKSVDFLSSVRPELISRMIKSTETLWDHILDLNDTYGSLMAMDSLFLPQEIDAALRSPNNNAIWQTISQCQDEAFLHNIIKLTSGKKGLKERLFVSDRLWVIYKTINRVYGRFGSLIHWSVQKQKYVNWQHDEFFLSILQEVLPDSVINNAKTKEFGDLRTIMVYLEAEFVNESRSVMSGSAGFSEAFSDIQGILKFETGEIRRQRNTS